MNWEDIGMMVGYNLANGYFKNQHDRWVDEGRKALKDMATARMREASCRGRSTATDSSDKTHSSCT